MGSLPDTTENQAFEVPDLTSKAISGNRAILGKVLTVVSGLCAALLIVPLLLLLINIFNKGLSRITPELFTELPPPPGLTEGGIGHAIIGSIMTLSIAAAVSFPFGVLAAIYLAEFGRGTRIAYLVKFSANVLTGVPAILCGLFAYSVVVVPLGYFSAFSGGIALGVLMLPIVIRSTEESLLLVPMEMRQAAIGIGATRFQTIMKITLPAALPAIVTGLVLSLARAAGEAAPLLFTAFNNSFWSTDPRGPIATLPVLIYFFSIVPFKAQQELAWAAALVLIVIVLISSLLGRLLIRAKRI
ncbi:phosphate ABC transporter permease PstA [Geitlerinema sp. P-1104]|uniref:phosphate ABC transporter permease PstA n=1 Tax=Geitlerinema sp. P-1104 TaxID=2546230 RepID=UPI001476B0A9|nr:phosphate ABC transporter permease PstA [Geitlerinema sp. P-1104]NMG57434.1 phosphate ABC transporter permease PstA [Geitlerinema sp. P-1104]